MNLLEKAARALTLIKNTAIYKKKGYRFQYPFLQLTN